MGNQPSKNTGFSVLNGVVVFFLMLQLASLFVVSVNCQSESAFTIADVFEIPTKNSSISFAVNGTYEKAILENDTWFFEGLYFSSFFASEKLNITVSATDCHLTINPYLIFSRTSQGENVTWVLFTYKVHGKGTQVINLGLDPQKGHLDAILDGEFLGLNHGWTRSSDGTIMVTAPASNVTLWYYGHPESYLQESDLFGDHYVVIGSTFLTITTVGFAAVITRKKPKGET